MATQPFFSVSRALPRSMASPSLAIARRSFFFSRRRRYVGAQDPFGGGAFFLAGALGAGTAIYTFQPMMQKKKREAEASAAATKGEETGKKEWRRRSNERKRRGRRSKQNNNWGRKAFTVLFLIVSFEDDVVCSSCSFPLSSRFLSFSFSFAGNVNLFLFIVIYYSKYSLPRNTSFEEPRRWIDCLVVFSLFSSLPLLTKIG